MKSFFHVREFQLVCTLIAALLGVTAEATTIIHVNHSAIGAGNGTDWANAFPDLQDALLAADAVVSGGDDAEIWVASGTYKPTTDPTHRTVAFHLRPGVAIFGGFAGTETSRNDRDVQSNETVLSGDIDANDLPRGELGCDASQIAGGNSFHVVIGSGVGESALLDGFVITGGDAGSGDGGGILITAGHAVLRNVTVCGNAATRGGGLCSRGAGTSVSAENAVISHNTAFEGGGIENDASSALLLMNSTVDNNSATDGDGGGLNNANATATLINVRIIGNSATDPEEMGRGWGGGIHNIGYTGVEHVTLRLTGALVYGNHAIAGAGIAMFHSADAVLYNVTITENSASQGPDALLIFRASPFGYSSAIVENSIIWNNPSGEGAEDDISNTEGTRLLVHHSDIPFAAAGSTNIAEDPLFGVLGRPQAGSPVIDSGIPLPGLPPVDLDGNPRVIGAAIDMGAYEYEPPLTLSAEMTPVTCHGGNDGAIDLTIAGGTGTYEITWTPGDQTTEDLPALTAGTYTAAVVDSDGCEETLSVTVTEPSLTVVTLAIEPMGTRDGVELPIVQYSDRLELNATITPGLDGTIVYALKRGTSIIQSLGTANVVDGIAETLTPRIAPVRGRIGPHSVEAIFSGNGCPDVTIQTMDVFVDSEDAVLTPHPSNRSAVTEAEAAAGFTLEFTIHETYPEPAGDPPGVEAGNINYATIYPQLLPVGGTLEMSGTCTPGDTVEPDAYVERTIVCSFENLPVDTYELIVTTGTTAFRATYVDTFTVYDPSAGFVTGGGTFLYPGSDDRVNFGLVYRFMGKDKTTPRGNLLAIRHMSNGDVCSAKSNGIGTPSISQNTAGFSGRANYLCTRPDGTIVEESGNLTLTGWVEDNDTTAESDRVWIRIAGTALEMQKPTAPNAAPLTGGNIQVPQNERK